MDKNLLISLVNKKYSTREISKELNISQTNVRYWLSKFNLKTNPKISESDFDIYQRCIDIVSKNKNLYNYIFGLYLGDGQVYRLKGNLYYLCITQDAKYYDLVNSCKEAMEKFIGNNVSIRKRQNCYEIKVHSNMIKHLFPKYGTGSKYLNKVFLPKILIDNIDYANLVKGLFESDGSYYYDKLNKKYCYSFSNMSKEIISIYIECLRKLNIEFDHHIKSSGVNHVNIRKKEMVLKFKKIVGIK